jgi:uncharacterized OB-fold protein
VTAGGGKPQPQPTTETLPFWEGTREGRLHLPFCQACRAFFFYPRLLCPRCGGGEIAWRDVSGRGRVHTFSINYVPQAPGFADDVPYVTALIDLDEGPRMMTRLVEVEPRPEAIRVGMRVEVVFADGGGFVLPLFRPIADTSQE